MHTNDPKMQKCIEECSTCYSTCIQTITHCLEKGGEHASVDHINLLQDCAEICKISASYMLRGSNNHMKTCGLCAEICTMCAEDCEKMENDEEMKKCAEVCRSCAESCSEMASM